MRHPARQGCALLAVAALLYIGCRASPGPSCGGGICADGESCIDGECVPGAEGPACIGVVCPEGQSCESGECVPIALGECRVSGDCAPGELCSNGACVALEITGDVQAGAAFNAVQCASCHGEAGEGGVAANIQRRSAAQLQAGIEGEAVHNAIAVSNQDYADLQAFLASQ